MPADRVVEAPLAQGVYDPALACHRYLARQAPGIFAARGRFGPAADGLLVFPHASVGVAAEGPELARFPLSCLLLDGGQERFDGRQRLGRRRGRPEQRDDVVAPDGGGDARRRRREFGQGLGNLARNPEAQGAKPAPPAAVGGCLWRPVAQLPGRLDVTPAQFDCGCIIESRLFCRRDLQRPDQSLVGPLQVAEPEIAAAELDQVVGGLFIFDGLPEPLHRAEQRFPAGPPFRSKRLEAEPVVGGRDLVADQLAGEERFLALGVQEIAPYLDRPAVLAPPGQEISSGNGGSDGAARNVQ